MNNNKALPIVIKDTAILPNEDGMYCLNDIAKAAGLTGRKVNPSEWRTKSYYRLRDTQKLRTVHGDKGATYGTEFAALKYAAWVDDDFEDMVFEVFQVARNNPEAAQLIARELSAEARGRFFKQIPQQKDVVLLSEVADTLGITTQKVHKLAEVLNLPVSKHVWASESGFMASRLNITKSSCETLLHASWLLG